MQELPSNMSLDSDPPRELWTEVTVMKKVEDKFLEEKMLVPFEASEVDVIEKARTIVEELSSKGEQGSDGIIREFWAFVGGGGFTEGFLPNEKLIDRKGTIWSISYARSIAQRCIKAYEDAIAEYPYALSIGRMEVRKGQLGLFDQLLGQMIPHPIKNESAA